MTGASLLVAALVASQIQVHPTGLKSVGLSHKRAGVRTVQILDKLYEQAGKPSLDLDLARFKDLHDNATGETSLVTFTRSSMGTYVDSTGLIKRSAVNELLYSEQFDNAAWAKINVTVSANQIVSPDGKQTADKISETATTDFHRVDDTATVSTGATYTLSAYFKAGERNRLLIRTFDGSANISIACKDDGTIASIEGTPLASSNEDAGNGWRRCSMTYTVASGTTGYLRFGPIDSGSSASYAGTAGHGIHIWGAQLEEGSTATPYIRTTSTISGASRFDHDPVTGESLGLLVEEARTNLVFPSEDLSSATLANSGTGALPVRTNNYGVAPDGQTTAERFVFNRGAGTTLSDYSLALVGSPSISTGEYLTSSVYVKSLSGTKEVIFYVAGLGTAPAIAVENVSDSEWKRIYITSGIAASSGQMALWIGTRGTYGGDQNLDVLVWGVQAEKNVTFPTSYIPTSGSTVTRAADIAAVQDADFSTTNLLAYSEAFTSWGDTNISRDSATETAPDGQATALQVSASSANGTVIYPAAMGTSAERVFSIYLRRVTGTGDIQYTLDNGSNWTTQAITSTWQRYIFPKTTAAQRPGIRIVTSGDAIEMWGASLTATEYPVAYTTTRNLLTDSQDFERGTWVKTAATIGNDVAQAPDGTLTADKIVENLSTAVHRIDTPTNIAAISGVSYIYTLYAKPDGRDWIAIQLQSAFGGGYAYFNLSNGTIGANTTTAESITNVGGGWYRISITVVATATGSGAATVVLANGDNVPSYAGDNTSGVLIWGAQLEPGTVATDYVRTVDTVGKAYRWYEPTEGTVFVEAKYPIGVGTTFIMGMSNGSTSSFFGFRTSGFHSNGTVGTMYATVLAGQQIKGSFAVSNSTAGLSVDGILSTGLTSYTVPIVSEMRIGDLEPNANRRANAHIKRLTYWPRRQPDATLQVITQ